jgi:putative transcriptional regulator
METLKNHFLISTLQMPDPRFQEQVVYVCAHNEEGAMGLVINNPTHEITLIDIFKGANLPLPTGELPPVYMGGPVEMESGFILFSSDYHSSFALQVSEDVCLSRDTKLLADIANGQGPAHYIFLLGYAGWAPGQLEAELMDNSWLTVPGDSAILFNTPDQFKWKQAAGQFGIDITTFGTITGTA